MTATRFHITAENAKTKLLDDPQPIDSHHRGLTDNVFGNNEAAIAAKQITLTMKVCLLHPASSRSYFLTTDNPGFTRLDNKIFNTNYERFDAVGFPLASKDSVYFIEPWQLSNFQL